jgi:Ni2+-binding GTPase involved in maturation of urease and hydrogenase
MLSSQEEEPLLRMMECRSIWALWMMLLLGPPSSGKTTSLLALVRKLDKMLRSSDDITYKRVRPPRVRAIEDVGVHQSLSMEEDDHPDRSQLACAHEVLHPPHVARGREYMVTQMG